MPYVQQETTNQTSTNSYVSLLKVRLGHTSKASAIITNSHATNTIQYKVLYSNDLEGASGSWYQKVAETDIAPYASEPANAKQLDIDPTPIWVDIQIKSKLADTHGTGNAWLKAVGL